MKKKFRNTAAIIFTMFTFSTSVFLVFLHINYNVMPSVCKYLEAHGTAVASAAINKSVKAAIANIKSDELYTVMTDGNGTITALSADTIKINDICANVSQNFIDELSHGDNATIMLPLGILSGIDFLKNTGPNVLKVSVRTIGDCVVDYKTSFKSEGINQTNYQIWLEIRSAIVVINPLVQEDTVVTRDIAIVNSFIGGNVPGAMMFPFGNASDNS